ncbi:outer dynein arm-docking complex subunit 4 isoform X2 [Cynoglossus semilaevis]|uniref:outer dynein arm-docking complex subunit 4 isoform X2 n=1 Tax=Cynoglossus semilaevis TaxID=244447 RepID=UPI0004971AC9|nr:tetratricopeptide repeat protein 25 isoform X2 [Cynoglossus semilaevis]
MSETDGDRNGVKSKGVFSTLVADGSWLYLKGEYKKAIESYTTALTLRPNEKSCLIGRSKCYLKLGQHENALRDAEASLKEDKTFFEGLHQKAEALYHMGEFEFALVFYHRGQKLRPQIQEFRLGIQKSQEAIETSVGDPSSIKLEIKGDLSFLQKDEERSQPLTTVQHQPKDNKTRKVPKNKKTTKQLLGEFYGDKLYLENLMKDKDLVKGKTRGGEHLQDVIQSCLTYLDTCTELLIQEKPVCTQEKDRKQVQPKCQRSCSSAPSDPTRFLLKSLNEIDAEMTAGNAAVSLKKAKDILTVVERWSEKEVPDRKEILGSLHSCIGNALIDLGDMDAALQHHQKDLKLAEQRSNTEATSRALDNIGRVYAQTGQFTKAIEFWEKKIPLLRSALEKTWIFHEIGWCYLELGDYEEARDYGLRSLAVAEEIGDEKWQLNANVLVAQSEMKLGLYESCVRSFEKALTCASLKQDHSAMNAIQKALDEAKQHVSD